MTPVAAPAGGRPVLDVARVRADFPILERQVHGRPLRYLDNAATTQKPRVVIDAISRYYGEYNANVHRGVHRLSELASEGPRPSCSTGARSPRRSPPGWRILSPGTRRPGG